MFRSWLHSLYPYSPYRIGGTIRQASYLFYRASTLLIQYFGGLIVFDAIWQSLFHDTLVSTLQTKPEAPLQLSLGLSFVMLIASVVWYVLNTSFFLALRRTTGPFQADYYSNGILRYTQLSLVFSFIFLVGILVFGSLGIIHYPVFSGLFVAFIRMIGIIIAFFWLDSSFQFKDLIKSTERGLNLFLYNLPFFLVTLGLYAALSYCFLMILQKLCGLPCDSLSIVLQGNYFHQSLTSTPGTLAIILRTLLVKYSMFFINHFILCLLFILYMEKKTINYVDSLFE